MCNEEEGVAMRKPDDHQVIKEPTPEREQRRRWQEPELKRRETLPRVTNGFAGSWQP